MSVLLWRTLPATDLLPDQVVLLLDAFLINDHLRVQPQSRLLAPQDLPLLQQDLGVLCVLGLDFKQRLLQEDPVILQALRDLLEDAQLSLRVFVESCEYLVHLVALLAEEVQLLLVLLPQETGVDLLQLLLLLLADPLEEPPLAFELLYHRRVILDDPAVFPCDGLELGGVEIGIGGVVGGGEGGGAVEGGLGGALLELGEGGGLVQLIHIICQVGIMNKNKSLVEFVVAAVADVRALVGAVLLADRVRAEVLLLHRLLQEEGRVLALLRLQHLPLQVAHPLQGLDDLAQLQLLLVLELLQPVRHHLALEAQLLGLLALQPTDGGFDAMLLPSTLLEAKAVLLLESGQTAGELLESFLVLLLEVLELLDEEVELPQLGLRLAVLAEAEAEFGLELLQLEADEGDVLIDGVDLPLAELASALAALLDVDVGEVLSLDLALLSLGRLRPDLVPLRLDDLHRVLVVVPDAADEEALEVGARGILLLVLEAEFGGLDPPLLPTHPQFEYYNINELQVNLPNQLTSIICRGYRCAENCAGSWTAGRPCSRTHSPCQWTTRASP